MARMTPLWQQGGSYPATLDRLLLGSLWPTGGASGAVPAPVANTMNVNVPVGVIAVPLQAGQGVALCRWDAPEVVTLDAAAAQPRIDVVIAQVRDTALDAGPNNDFVFTFSKGVPAANPVAPAIPNNAYALVNVLVPANAANLNGATVTDRRRGMATLDAPPVCRVYLAASPVTPSGANFLVPFDTVDPDVGDSHGGWSMVTRLYSAPVAGLYDVAARAESVGAVAANNYRIFAYKNGALAITGLVIGWAAGNGNIGLPLADKIRLAAGDTLGVYVNFQSATQIVAGRANAFLSIARIAP